MPIPSFRILPWLVSALLAMLLCAAPVAAADPCARRDAGIPTHEGASHTAALPAKPADHASRRQRHNASLEEFVGLDDDAEQYLKPLAVLLRPIARPAFVVATATFAYRTARPDHPACAAPATGPPHA